MESASRVRSGGAQPRRGIVPALTLTADAFALALALALPRGAAAAVLAITGATLVGIDDGRPVGNAVVLIENERVIAAGPADRTPVPEGARRLELPGHWLLPGLINTHVHLGLKLPGAAGAALASESDPEEVLRMAGNARASLLAGCTTLRLVGEDHGTDFALRKAIEAGHVPGPRLQTAGEVIVPTGGHGSLEGDGPYALARLVRTQIHSGADWIKIAISGGIADERGSISAAPMTDEEMSTLIEVAHRNGIRVTAHNGSVAAARQALRFGIDGFEHGYHLDEPVLREMKTKGVWLVPTIVVTQPGAMEFYRRIGSPPWYLERVGITGADHWRALETAIRIGVPIALGTDQFPFEPNDGTTATVAEAELYVKAGMTPLQALQSATTQAARMLRMEGDVGRIAPGRYADLLAVQADPVQDIRALRTLDFVMKGGIVFRDDARGR